MASVRDNGKKPQPCRHHMTIIRELFDHIDATGMKRGKFAARAGYAHASLCHYASGQATPNLQAFLNLCETAGISVLLVPNDHVAAHNDLTNTLNAATTTSPRPDGAAASVTTEVTSIFGNPTENKDEHTDQTSA